MEQTIAQLIARAAGGAFTATSRPALTFFLCQLAIAMASRAGWIKMEPSMLWLVSVPMLVAGLIATVVEILVEHSDEVEEVVRNVHIDKVWRVIGSFFVGLLMISIGVDSAAETVVPALASAEQLGTTTAGLGDSGQPVWVKALVVVGSIGLTQGLSWLRGSVLAWLDDLHLKKFWQYVETGGVLGFLIVLALSPMLMVVLAGLVTLVMIVVALAVRGLDKMIDKSRRHACPSCGERIRDEALMCWKCKTEVEPARWLTPDSSAGLLTRLKVVSAEWMAARRAEHADESTS
jgi:hypothetical protein